VKSPLTVKMENKPVNQKKETFPHQKLQAVQQLMHLQNYQEEADV
jgi:hypothetical protein